MRSKKRRYYRSVTSRRVKSKGVWFKPIFWGLLLILVIALGRVWQRVAVLKLTQEVEGLRSEVSEIEKKYKYLNIEIADLSSVERIESIAIKELGLTYPRAERIVYLNEPLIPSLGKEKDSYMLWAKLKKTANNFLFITEERLEAKEIKHDL